MTELDQFRREVEAWFKTNRPPEPKFLLPESFMEVGSDEQFEFLRAWQRLGDLQEANRFGGWFCRIVRNIATDAVRRGPRPAESIDDHLAIQFWILQY